MNTPSSISTVLLQIYAGGWHHSAFTAAARMLLEQEAKIKKMAEERVILDRKLSAAMSYIAADIDSGA